MAKRINGHSFPKSAIAMATVAIPVAPPLQVRLQAAETGEASLSFSTATWKWNGQQYANEPLDLREQCVG